MTPEALARIITDELSRIHHNSRYSSCWIDADVLTAVMLDGTVDMVSLAEVILTALDREPRLSDEGSITGH